MKYDIINYDEIDPPDESSAESLSSDDGGEIDIML